MQRSLCATQSLSTDSSVFTVQQKNESVLFSESGIKSLQKCFAIIQSLVKVRLKIFKETQADKARFNSDIAEELKKFMKDKARHWI